VLDALRNKKKFKIVTTLYTLDLSRCNIDSSSASSLSESLKINTTLTEINLDCTKRKIQPKLQQQQQQQQQLQQQSPPQQQLT